MASRVEVIGEEETARALTSAAAVASDPRTLAAAGDLALPAARLLGPNDTGALAASYQLVSGDPPGIVSTLIHAAIVEYGWAARSRPAHMRVHAAWDMQADAIAQLIDGLVEDAGGRVGL